MPKKVSREKSKMGAISVAEEPNIEDESEVGSANRQKSLAT